MIETRHHTPKPPETEASVARAFRMTTVFVGVELAASLGMGPYLGCMIPVTVLTAAYAAIQFGKLRKYRTEDPTILETVRRLKR